MTNEIKGCDSSNGLSRELSDISRMAKTRAVRREQPNVKQRLIDSGEDQCYVCGYDCTPLLHLHHIVLVKDGGDNAKENVVMLCPNCHSLVHSFLSDSMEAKYGLDYAADWMNKNLCPKGIERVRNIWRKQVGRGVS